MSTSNGQAGVPCDYEAEAKVVVSPDGSKVLFTSNWNVDGNGGDTLDYVIEIGAAPARAS